MVKAAHITFDFSPAQEYVDAQKAAIELLCERLSEADPRAAQKAASEIDAVSSRFSGQARESLSRIAEALRSTRSP